MDLSAQRELAVLLATLRRDGRQQSGLDARLVPPDQATAYRVATWVAEELGWAVGGWKTAAMNRRSPACTGASRRDPFDEPPGGVHRR